MNGKLVISSSPHIRTIQSVQSIMLDVLIALGPVVLVAVFLFGKRHDNMVWHGAPCDEPLAARWNIFGTQRCVPVCCWPDLPANVPW